jgi:hypothetical protein
LRYNILHRPLALDEDGHHLRCVQIQRAANSARVLLTTGRRHACQAAQYVDTFFNCLVIRMLDKF